jgi:hypothetical protein
LLVGCRGYGLGAESPPSRPAIEAHPELARIEHDPPEGRLSGEQVVRHWREHDYRLAVHPATLCARRGHVLAAGGWMALPASGDTGLLIALAVLAPGYFSADVGLLYRKWSGQLTSEAAHREPGEWWARMRLIEARAEALAALWQPAREPV